MDVFLHDRFDALYRQHPLVLADAGARGGLRKNWQAARRHLRLLGFEPDRQEFSRLAARTTASPHGDTFFNVALHSEPGSVTLQVARDPGLSSIFAPNLEFLRVFPEAARFETIGQRQVDTDTIDNVLRANGIDDLDFIKADTQGSELLVLRGAARALAATVVGVEVEVVFTAMYVGQPLFADVDAYMREQGFMLFDLRPCFWKREAGLELGGPYGQIIWADALYLKSVAALGGALSAAGGDRRRSKLLKAISIALLYGYADYALELVRRLGAAWAPSEAGEIERTLRAQTVTRDSLGNVPGRRQLSAGVRRLWRLLREPSRAWSVSDPDLGNVE